MTISQEDARRAIALLVRVSDRTAGLAPSVTLDDEVNEFLFDDAGDPRFNERDDDPSPMCRCGECSPGDYTCVSRD